MYSKDKWEIRTWRNAYGDEDYSIQRGDQTVCGLIKNKANARLLVQAPKLYEVLSTINASKDPMGDTILVHKMVNVLREVEGK